MKMEKSSFVENIYGFQTQDRFLSFTSSVYQKLIFSIVSSDNVVCSSNTSSRGLLKKNNNLFVLFFSKAVTAALVCSDIPTAERVDCGIDGVDEAWCLNHSCCFKDVDNSNVPKCYYGAGSTSH